MSTTSGGESTQASFEDRADARLAVAGREAANVELTGVGEPGAIVEGPDMDAFSVFWREVGSDGGGKD